MSAWQVVEWATGRPVGGRLGAAYGSGLAVMGVLVGVLQLAGAAVIGLAGAPLLLGLLLAVASAVLGRWGLLPA